MSRFKLEGCLGIGTFGEIYKAYHLGEDPKNLIPSRRAAIKMEKVEEGEEELNGSHLFHEAKVYQYLWRNKEGTIGQGIGQVFYCGYEKDKQANVMVMDLLGPSLEVLFRIYNNRFSLKTILMVGDEMIKRIEFLHSRSILHRDIKPDNFVIPLDLSDNKVYVIDFGLAKKYKSSEGEHIPMRTGKSLTGTARFTSVNTHQGIEQGRRDDLESLAYSLIYFVRGELPWQSLQILDKKEKYQMILDMKLNIPMTELCKGCPPEFMLFLTYCRNLEFDQVPDYDYLRKLLKKALFRQYKKTEYDYDYDWRFIPSHFKKFKKAGNIYDWYEFFESQKPY